MAWLILTFLVVEAAGTGQATWGFLIIVMAISSVHWEGTGCGMGDVYSCHAAGRALLF